MEQIKEHMALRHCWWHRLMAITNMHRKHVIIGGRDDVDPAAPGGVLSRLLSVVGLPDFATDAIARRPHTVTLRAGNMRRPLHNMMSQSSASSMQPVSGDMPYRTRVLPERLSLTSMRLRRDLGDGAGILHRHFQGDRQERVQRVDPPVKDSGWQHHLLPEQ